MTDEELNRIIAKRFGVQDKRIDKLTDNYTARLLKNYNDAKKQIQNELDYANWRYDHNKNLVQIQALENKLNRIKHIINNLNTKSTSILSEGLSYSYKDNYYRTGFILESSTGINLSFSLINENVVRHALLNPLDKIKWKSYDIRLKGHNTKLKKDIIDSINNTVKEEIAKGITSGQGIDKIANSIQNKISKYIDVTFSKAQNIARTEVHRVTSIARQDAFNVTNKAANNLNMKAKRMWLATFDGRTRQDHQQMDKKYADSQGYWVPSLGRYIEGISQSGDPSFDINCRCTETTEIEGYELKTRLDNVTKEIVPAVTYQEWVTDILKNRKN